MKVEQKRQGLGESETVVQVTVNEKVQKMLKSKDADEELRYYFESML